MITNRQRNLIVIVCSNSLFFGFGYSLIFKSTSNNSWICSLIAGIFGIIFTFILKRIMNNKKTINNYLNKNILLKTIIKAFFAIINITIIFINLFIIKEFIKTFFLINMPSIIISIPILFLILLISHKDFKTLSYLYECLVPISLTLIFFIILSLIFKCDFSNLKPYFSSNTISMIKSIFYYFTLSTSPLIILYDIDLKDNNISNIYLFNILLITTLSVLISGILGNYLIKIYTFLEYTIIKDIQIFNFIEKIENILSLSWVINSFLIIFLSSISLKKNIFKKYNNYIFVFIILAILIVVNTILDNSYFNYLYLYIPYIIGIISLLTLSILYILYLKLNKRK